MRHHLLALVLALGVSAPAVASETAIHGVIADQFRAFLNDDFVTAFGFASPTIKGIFGTPERFGQMVRQGYPMVHRSQDLKFLELREVGGALWQRVMVTDGQGRLHMLDYQMIETPEGWQINGVQILKAPAVGA